MEMMMRVVFVLEMSGRRLIFPGTKHDNEGVKKIISRGSTKKSLLKLIFNKKANV